MGRGLGGEVFIEKYGKKVPDKAKVIDTESDPAKTIGVASKLILRDKVKLMVTMHTPDRVNTVVLHK